MVIMNNQYYQISIRISLEIPIHSQVYKVISWTLWNRYLTVLTVLFS